jgi:hypothetical protein
VPTAASAGPYARSLRSLASRRPPLAISYVASGSRCVALVLALILLRPRRSLSCKIKGLIWTRVAKQVDMRVWAEFVQANVWKSHRFAVGNIVIDRCVHAIEE